MPCSMRLNCSRTSGGSRTGGGVWLGHSAAMPISQNSSLPPYSASGASALLVFALRELAAANRRFEDFVKEISSLNRLFQHKD